jgi:hemin uptake protein HemP
MIRSATMQATPATDPNENPRPVPGVAPCSVTSQELMRGGRMLVIRHGTHDYRLQITASGKLILTK